jgi:NADH dehydrogenase
VPPRAQSRTRCEPLVARHRRLTGPPHAAPFYRDFGSLVSLGDYDTMGQLMGFVAARNSASRAGSRSSSTSRSTAAHLGAARFWRMALDTLAR